MPTLNIFSLWAFRHLILMWTSECDSHLQKSPCQDLLLQSKNIRQKKDSSWVLSFKTFSSRFIRTSDLLSCDQPQAPPSGLAGKAGAWAHPSGSIRIHPSSCLSIMPLVGGASSPPECLRSQSASQSRRNHIRSQHPPWNRPLEKASSMWGLHEGTFMNIHHGAL